MTLQDNILLVMSVFLKSNLLIKSQYTNDQRIKTFTNCNINKLYLILLNLLAYLSLLNFKRF